MDTNRGKGREVFVLLPLTINQLGNKSRTFRKPNFIQAVSIYIITVISITIVVILTVILITFTISFFIVF